MVITYGIYGLNHLQQNKICKTGRAVLVCLLNQLCANLMDVIQIHGNSNEWIGLFLSTDHRPTTDRPSTNRPLTNHLPTTYWPPTDHLPTNHLPTTYQPLTNHLPTTYWPPTNHLPTTYQPTTYQTTNHFFMVQLVHNYPLITWDRSGLEGSLGSLCRATGY